MEIGAQLLASWPGASERGLEAPVSCARHLGRLDRAHPANPLLRKREDRKDRPASVKEIGGQISICPSSAVLIVEGLA